MANIRKPNTVHQLQGTYRKDRHDGTIEVSTPVPPPPSFLDALAQKEYNRIVALMQKYKTLTASDLVPLSIYCQLYSELQREKDEFKAAKYAILIRTANELGLTPNGRQKLRTDADTKPSQNEFDDV